MLFRSTIGGSGPFTVSGSHKFGGFNNVHALTVTIYDKGGSQVTVTDNLIDPPALQDPPMPSGSEPVLQVPQPLSSSGPGTAVDPGSGPLAAHRRPRRHRASHHARPAHHHRSVAPRPGHGHRKQ